ncbi:MAG: ASKHA domain-containing protein, partial [Acetobacteraceae bacterium]|nr:ASKHA domain-containing protein [Acetobacteraceae bacterium]
YRGRGPFLRRRAGAARPCPPAHRPSAAPLPRPPLGLAVDLGTTSVAVALVDLADGRVLRLTAAANPQACRGADVISRILYASASPAALRELQGLAVECINRLAREALAEAGVRPSPAGICPVAEAVVVGNVAMLHLFLGLDPSPLGHAPYRGRLCGPVRVQARSLGLGLGPEAGVYVLPVIGGFVGADAVGVLLATGIHRRRGWHLALDLGTNGEVMLARRGRVLACSTAAGPAFEGVGLSCGMRAAPGAINSVSLYPSVALTTVGGLPPLGICGSGLIDLAAGLLEAGLLDPGGRVLTASEARGAGPLAARLRRVPVPGRPGLSQSAFVVTESGCAPAGGGGAGEGCGTAILLTQADVRALQLAKGAVAAASRFLLETAGVGPGELEGVWVAGTFGNCLSARRAAALGLLPALEPRRLRFCGNAALEGARLALIDARARREAERVASRAEHVALFGRPRFDELFLDSLRFAPWGWGEGAADDRGRASPK